MEYPRTLCVLTAVLGLAAACGTPESPATPTTPAAAAAPTLVSISIAPTNIALTTIGATSQIIVTGHYSDGTTKDLTTTAPVSSSNMAVATADQNGTLTAWSNGTATLTAIDAHAPSQPSVSGAVTVLAAFVDSPAPAAPTLISPANGATLPNYTSACALPSGPGVWSFAWSAVPGATAYHLLVRGGAAMYPSADVAEIATTSYAYCTIGSVIDANLAGWQWMVQAKVGGVYQAWSATGTFNVQSLSSTSAR